MNAQIVALPHTSGNLISKKREKIVAIESTLWLIDQPIASMGKQNNLQNLATRASRMVGRKRKNSSFANLI